MRVKRSLLSSMAAMFFPHGQRRRWLGILHSYGDESGTHDGSPVVSVALAISTEFHWNRFEEEWRELVLKPNGISIFHMQEFARKANSFYGCPRDRWQRTLDYVVNILRRRVQYRLSVGIDVAAMARVRLDERSRSKKARILSPYTQCVVGDLTMVGIVLDHYSVPDMVGYIFESGHKNWPEAAELLTNWKRDDRHRQRLRIQSFAPGRKGELMQLQAGDALAYASCQALIARHFPNSDHTVSVEPVAALIHKPGYMTGDGLNSLYAEIGGQMRLLRTSRAIERVRRKRSDAQS